MSDKRPGVGAATRAWAAASIHPGASVTRVRRLRGGISSAVDQITVRSPSGATRQLVLRRWLRLQGGDDIAECIRSEARTLSGLAPLAPIPAPELVAYDPTGEHTEGAPALLMTRLRGRIQLSPASPDAWIGQMAATLARIHSAPFVARAHQRWFDVDDLAPPAWSRQQDAWRSAIDYLRRPPPAAPAVFLHGDFQHFNLLWSRGRITGVVDWVWSCSGPAEVDVAHCMLNLAVLHSPEWAERFRLRYEKEAGRRTNPEVELAGVFNYGEEWKTFIPIQVAGRAAVDLAGVDARVDQLLLGMLGRC